MSAIFCCAALVDHARQLGAHDFGQDQREDRGVDEGVDDHPQRAQLAAREAGQVVLKLMI